MNCGSAAEMPWPINPSTKCHIIMLLVGFLIDNTTWRKTAKSNQFNPHPLLTSAHFSAQHILFLANHVYLKTPGCHIEQVSSNQRICRKEVKILLTVVHYTQKKLVWILPVESSGSIYMFNCYSTQFRLFNRRHRLMIYWWCVFLSSSQRCVSTPRREATYLMTTFSSGWVRSEELLLSCWRTLKSWSSSFLPWRPTCTL